MIERVPGPLIHQRSANLEQANIRRLRYYSQPIAGRSTNHAHHHRSMAPDLCYHGAYSS